ncbi:virulence RhuM family protein [Candidatus Saccharibacteria bacterium]|nr:virulence RhuM family protein [Candidatus Saccharibacteria bacterium]
MNDGFGNVLLYQTEDGKSQIEVSLKDDTVWLSIDQMADLFQRNKSTISRHIKGILESGELAADSTVAFFATVQNEGSREVERQIAYYNLDMIISVGYRVNSHRGVQFRIWATNVLREYLIKGFALNDDLLKLSGKALLNHAGKISAEVAKAKADGEYTKFSKRVALQLSPVEKDFLDNFEKAQKKMSSIKTLSNKNSAM